MAEGAGERCVKTCLKNLTVNREISRIPVLARKVIMQPQVQRHLVVAFLKMRSGFQFQQLSGPLHNQV